MGELGIGIIGSGFMGRTYAETLTRYCGGAALRAVTGGTRAAQLAADYEVACDPSVAALLARADVQAVFIATPHHLHAEQALAAARAGKHMLIEKPMACSVADCDAVLAACAASGVQCSVAFSQRARICNMEAKRLIDADAIGRVQQIKEFALVATGLNGLPAWQSDPRNIGILFGHAIHNFDRIRWLTGQEIRTVYARCGSIEPDARVEGTSQALMTLADGAVASLWSSYEVAKPSFPRAQFSAWLVGDKGLMEIDAYGELRVATDGAWRVVTTQAPIDWQGKGFLDPVRLESFTRQCQAFIDAVRAGRQPPVTGWDGRQAVAAALACYDSSAAGREIALS